MDTTQDPHDKELAAAACPAPTSGQTPNSLGLYSTAKSCLGFSMVSHGVPIEFGCASSVNMVHRKAFGVEIGGGASTKLLYETLLKSPFFEKVDAPQPGDIIISPTGYSSIAFPHNQISNGHVGVVGIYGIMSNNSDNGLWQEKYTIDTWNARYKDLGGYPVLFFRRK